MNGPLISVIIPAYQSEKTILRAIKSAQSQSYRNIEIVVVDNASTDNTKKIIEEQQNLDCRLRLIRLEKNQGPAGGRNAGVYSSSGQFVAFLDSDDEWNESKLEKQLPVLMENPRIGIVICNSYNINSQTGYSYTYSSKFQPYIDKMEPHQISEDPIAFELAGPVRRILYSKCIINLSSVLLKKELFNQLGGFNAKFYGPEDLDFWIRLAQLTKFAYLPAPMVNRYYSSGNISMGGEKWLMNLLQYHKHCFTSDEYRDLRDLTRKNLEKFFRYLVTSYGLRGKRKLAIKTWFESLQYGVYPKLFVYTFLSLFGKKLFTKLIRFRQEKFPMREERYL